MIALGKRLTQLRRERGVTQETLAQHVGVTKAAVSKWENNQSLPDIAMLPVLAAYFDVSVDDLLAYRARLSRDELRVFHKRVTEMFARGEQEDAQRILNETVRRYYADAATLIECAAVEINHTLTPEGFTRAIEWLERACETGSPAEGRQAMSLRAFCLMALGRAEDAIEILRPMQEELMSTSQALAQAYAQAGQMQQATEQIQWSAYSALMELIGSIGLWATLPGAPAQQLQQLLKALDAAFSMAQMHPVMMLTAYACSAIGLLGAGEKEAALKALEEYVRIAQKDTLSPLMLRTAAPFDALDARLNELPIGTMPPVNEALALERVYSSVTDPPAFAALRGDARYESLLRTLKTQLFA